MANTAQAIHGIRGVDGDDKEANLLIRVVGDKILLDGVSYRSITITAEDALYLADRISELARRAVANRVPT